MGTEKVERAYYDAKDVMALLNVKQAKAYKLIKAVRDELIREGKLIPDYPAGKVPKHQFDLRCSIKH